MYLRNRTYSASTLGTTPFEKLWKSKPDLGNLRIFGCEAYAHVESHQRTKFASKTIRAMYLGHEPNVKGYRLYTSSPERIIVSRNVVFNETKSFFTEEPSADESPVSQLIDEIDDDDELSLRDETLALPAAPPASTIVTSAPNEGTPIVPRRSTRIRRGNPRYNMPPVHVPQSTLVEPLPPPTRPIENTPPTPSISEADTSESRVENTPPQPLDDSTSSRVEPAPQQSPSESPADIPLPSSPSHGPMSRTDTPAVTPEFIPVMMPPSTSTDSTSFDEDALCEQFESLVLSLFRLRPVANSDVDEHQLSKQHRLLVALALQSTGLPSNIRQAHASPEKHEWIKATDAEYNSLMQHNTWFRKIKDLVDPSLDGLIAHTRVRASIEEAADFFYFDSPAKLENYDRVMKDSVVKLASLYTLIERPQSPKAEHPLHSLGSSGRSPSCSAPRRGICYHDEFTTVDPATGEERRGWARCIHSVPLKCCPDMKESHGLIRTTVVRSGHVFIESSTPGELDYYKVHITVAQNDSFGGLSEMLYRTMIKFYSSSVRPPTLVDLV
ncbi:hypothetical protein LEN26_018385 [Aphanomyces euteiches]|nr:hypothetical protein LEN26_018385 [Aphanomyces euteiches]